MIVINYCFVGICGSGINNENVANSCFMGFGAHQKICVQALLGKCSKQMRYTKWVKSKSKSKQALLQS